MMIFLKDHLMIGLLLLAAAAGIGLILLGLLVTWFVDCLPMKTMNKTAFKMVALFTPIALIGLSLSQR